jgi:3-oxoacyl-[acyl-carrier-protein] synthase II
MTRRRVVVTGLGLISPVGNTIRRLGQPPGRPLGHRQRSPVRCVGLSCRFRRRGQGLQVEAYIPAKEARHMDTFIHYGVAARCRRWDAGLPHRRRLTEEQAERIGVLVGSGIGGLPMIEQNYNRVRERGARRISPFFVPASIINMISGHVSIRTASPAPTWPSSRPAPPACTASARPAG